MDIKLFICLNASEFSGNMIKERWQYDFSNLNSKTKQNKSQKNEIKLFWEEGTEKYNLLHSLPIMVSPFGDHGSPDSVLSIEECAVCVCSVAQSCVTLCDSMDCSLLGSSVHGIFLAKYWSGLPFPPPGGLPHPEVEPTSPALKADSLLLSYLGSPIIKECCCCC